MAVRCPSLLVLVATAALVGCSTQPARPPGLPPTPKSVTKDNPGGDAADPEEAALQRLLDEPWGHRRDRFGTLYVPFSDWKLWRRVFMFGHPTRATFRYGDNHLAVSTIVYTLTDDPDDPDACLASFWAKHAPLAEGYSVRLGESKVFHTTQEVYGETRPMTVKLVEGSRESLFSTKEYVGAVVAYKSWPGTCLIQAFAVVAGEHRDLAMKVRDRWVREGAPKLRWLEKVTEAPEPKTR